MEDSSDIFTASIEQHKETLSFETLDSDLNLAFNLQLQEAITASLSHSHDLSNLEQQLQDHKISASEFKGIRDDLHRRIHDKRVAGEIERMGEDEWGEYGDEFERPFEGGVEDEEVFRVYVKGVVVEVDESGGRRVLCGLGVAICDSSDELLFELRKPLFSSGSSRQCVELKALIEGLNAALALDLKRVVFYCDYYPLFQYVSFYHYSFVLSILVMEI